MMSDDPLYTATPRHRPREDVQASAPCLLCGAPTLTGQTTDGRTLHLDPSQTCYTVAWSEKAQAPVLFESSRAYPLHQCRSVATATTTRRKRTKGRSLGGRGKRKISGRAPLDPHEIDWAWVSQVLRSQPSEAEAEAQRLRNWEAWAASRHQQPTEERLMQEALAAFARQMQRRETS